MLPIWNFFLQKRQFTVLVMIGLLIWGTASVIFITKENSPEIQIPMGVVSVVLPGASAEDVERLVTDRLESRLANLQNLNKITSSSREGLSVISLEYDASADIDESIQKLKDEVDKAKVDLPTEANDPQVTDVNFADQPIQLISITADLPYAEFAKLGQLLKDELQTVPGVSRIDVSGVRDREIQVVVKKEEIARYGITLPQVVSAIGQSNASLPVGAITVDDITYNIAFEGNLDSVDDIAGIAILNVQGQIIYLRDIATVSDGVEEATSYSRASVGGMPSAQALTLSVYKTRGEDVTTTTIAVEEKLEELKKDVLLGSMVLVSYDAGDDIRKELGELIRVGLETIALVMICLFITIGWRESIVAGLSIPLSFLIAFIGLFYSGNTVNFISLFSLILAIGILVDSGIVVVEAVHTRLRLYGDKQQAAYEALREYAWPLIGGTLTTVGVFVPLFFISGIVGEFIASIPFTIIFVLCASIFVALGLVPLLTITFAASHESSLMKKQEEYAERARAWYAGQLHSFIGNRRKENLFLWLMGIGFIVALALPVIGVVKVSFFPQDDLNFMYVDIELPQGSSLEQTDLVVRAVEETLYGDERLASIISTVGGTSAFSQAPQSGNRFASITLNLVEEREQTSTEIVEDIKKKVAPIRTADISVTQPSGGPPVGAPILIKFLGDDQKALDDAVAIARETLESIPGTVDIDSSSKNEAAQFVLRIDRGKLAAVGLTPISVASTLRTAVSGTTATSLTGGEEDVDIIVSLNLNPGFIDPHDASDATIDAIREIPVLTPSGETVLLGSVLEASFEQGSAVINHEDRKRVVNLTGNVTPGSNSYEIIGLYETKMESVELPQGVEMSIGGENEETNKSFLEMGFALLGGIALMFVVLVLSFNSFRFSGYLLSIVPLSLIGVFFGLAVTRQALSFPSLLGVIALAGVIINHAIILMDSIIQRMKTGSGRTFKDIVIESATSRLRPIFLTTITTVVGMIPLAGASSIWGPLAFAILFGLSFAMILTLWLIPLLVHRWPGKLPTGIIR